MTENGDLFQKISSEMKSMSKGQRAISEYLISNGGSASRMTVAALSDAVGVSEATVVRYARRMGYEGYPEMVTALKESLIHRLTTVERIEDASGIMNRDDILGLILKADSEKILKALGEIDRNAFEESIDILLRSKRIYIMGMRSSSILAQFMNYYLRLILDNVSLVCPSGGGEVFEHLINLDSNDVLFAISFPRYSTGTIKAAEYANRVGAKVVVLTDSDTSPVSSFADEVIKVQSEMVSFVDSLVAPMSIINAIVAYIGMKRPEQTASKFRLLEENWKEYNVYSKDR